MKVKLSEKSAQQLSNIMYLTGKQNANYIIAQMITVFELELSKPQIK